MPNFEEISDEDIQKLLTEGGLKPETLKRRKQVYHNFAEFVANSGADIQQILPNKPLLESNALKFLEGYRVKKKGSDELIRPKAAYFNYLTSLLRSELLSITGFEDLTTVKKGVMATKKKIKTAGRAETVHTPEVPAETMDEIWVLCKQVQNVMVAREALDQEKYLEALNELPGNFRNSYHDLLRMCVQFIIHCMDCRRGTEGIELLTKDHFKIAEEGGIKYWEKVNVEYGNFRLNINVLRICIIF